MTTLQIHTNSYLFESSKGHIRIMPFYELATTEYVIFEKEKPKYYLDFNRQNLPLVQDIQQKLDKGEDLKEIIWKLGSFLGKDWTIQSKISGKELPNTQQNEIVSLLLLSDLSELFIDLTFVATDKIESEILLDEDKLFDKFYHNDELQLETSFIDSYENLINCLGFIFKTKLELIRISNNNEKDIFDLTVYKNQVMTELELESKYDIWLKTVDRENTMDEYGNLIFVLGYINKHKDKKHLLLIAEKRKHWN